MSTPTKPERVEMRFWNRVNKGGPPSPFVAGRCWEWTGLVNGQGYGRAYFDGRGCKAHRVSFELAGKTVPVGMELMHLCHNPPCVNPDHLEPGTHSQNMLAAGALGRLKGRPVGTKVRWGRKPPSCDIDCDIPDADEGWRR